MKTLYLDCGMGAAGDMLTAALLDLFDDPAPLVRELNQAFAGKAVLTLLTDQKCGVSGKHARVEIGGDVEGEEAHHHHHHTSLTEVRSFLSSLSLSEAVVSDALAVYDRIAAAEAQVHGKEISNIHFHEVGSLDAMADVVSVCFLIQRLKPEQILASAVHVGSGTVRCAHGELPVPAPATLLLLKDVPIYSSDVKGELCTPTGAALLGHFVSHFGNLPLMRVSKIGYGTGFKDFQRANVLRVLLGDTDEMTEAVAELSCNLDDMTAEELAFAQERLFALGALDVCFTSIGMKKSRPGIMLTCICKPDERDIMIQAIFRYTTTLGIRESVSSRYCLRRHSELRESGYGPVNVKISEGWGVRREKAEYEDLKRIASENDISLREIKIQGLD